MSGRRTVSAWVLPAGNQCAGPDSATRLRLSLYEPNEPPGARTPEKLLRYRMSKRVPGGCTTSGQEWEDRAALQQGKTNMIGLTVFSVVAGLVQLAVPSYALKLVRKWGIRQVGWFLAGIFALLALLHLANPMRSGTAPELLRDGLFMSASLVLLAGMIAVEKLQVRLRRAEEQEKQTLAASEQRTQEHTRQQLQNRDHWTQEIARRDEEIVQLKEAGEQYRALFHESPQALWVFDLRSLRVLTSNRAAQRLLAYPAHELQGRNARDLFAEEAAIAFLDDASRPCIGTEHRGTWRLRKRDGEGLTAEIMATDLMFCGTPARAILTTDIMERHVRDAQLGRDERLRAFSRVTEGVARHLGPMLTTIDDHLSAIMAECMDEGSMTRLMEILGTANRAATINRQLLSASGQEQLRCEPLDLSRVLSDQEIALKRLLGKTIALRLRLDTELPPALCNTGALQQVIMNLATNARDAMPQGGTLQVSTAEVKLNPAEVPADLRASASSSYALLSIRDTGSGLTRETQEHLFEPFFTTKPKATGLGLAMVKGLIRSHQGWIEYTTTPGTGTEFRIFLPLAPANAGHN